jgi:tetratricopeptide (TPR) repeat protein
VVCVLAALLNACTGQSRPPPPAATEDRILFHGCAEVRRDGHCGMSDRTELRVWIPIVDHSPCTATLGSRAIELGSEGEVHAGGWRIQLRPSVYPSRLAIECAGESPLRLALDLDRQTAPEWNEIERELSGAGRLAEAIAVLDRARRRSDSPAILSRRARLHARAGDWEASERDLVAAIVANTRAGRDSYAIRDIATLTFHRLNRLGDVAGAFALLDTAPQPLPGDAASAIVLANTRALAARLGADLTSSERHYRAALRLARRVGKAADEVAATSGLAQTLAELGRFDLALSSLRAVDIDAVTGFGTCDRARMRNARAWIGLLSNEAGSPGGDPLPDLDRAAAMLARDCAHLEFDRANVEVNRALAFVQRGETAAARGALRTARALQTSPPPHLRAWMLELDARIALAEGDAAAALRGFEELIDRSAAALHFEPQWRGHVGAAQAERRRGGNAAALRHFELADRLIRIHSDALPVFGSRASFVARYEQLPRAWIEVLLELGRTEEAWTVARRYRNEPLRQIQQALEIGALAPALRTQWLELAGRYRRFRSELDSEVAQDWALTAPELATVQARRRDRVETLRQLVAEAASLQPISARALPEAAPAVDSLGLLYFPGEQGWFGFAHTAAGVRAVRIASLDVDADSFALSAALLGPFRSELRAAGNLRILPYGPLRELDFHRLEFDGLPLASQLPVVYAADIDGPPVIAARRAHVALMGDPHGDLPHARAEVSAIANLWRNVHRHAEVELLVGGAITRESVVAAFARATIVHFSGHTVAAGFADERALGLADGQIFDAADVLVLQRVPDTVVLASCEGARPDAATGVDGLTMAHAFLARGGHQVVASSRPVDDAASAIVANTLHRLHAQGVPLERALAQAQARLRDLDPEADWSSFRLYAR